MAEDTLVFSFMQYYCCMKAQYFDLAQFFGQWCSSTTRKGEKNRSQICWLHKYSLKVLLPHPTDVLLPCIRIPCAVISCNHIPPVFPACIFAASAVTCGKRFQSRSRAHCARHNTKPCQTQSLPPKADRVRRSLQRQCDSFNFIFFFCQDTSKPLNSETPTSLWCCSTLNSSCELHWIPCVWEAVQQLERDNVGAQHP